MNRPFYTAAGTTKLRVYDFGNVKSVNGQSCTAPGEIPI